MYSWGLCALITLTLGGKQERIGTRACGKKKAAFKRSAFAVYLSAWEAEAVDLLSSSPAWAIESSKSASQIPVLEAETVGFYFRF